MHRDHLLSFDVSYAEKPEHYYECLKFFVLYIVFENSTKKRQNYSTFFAILKKFSYVFVILKIYSLERGEIIFSVLRSSVYDSPPPRKLGLDAWLLTTRPIFSQKINITRAGTKKKFLEVVFFFFENKKRENMIHRNIPVKYANKSFGQSFVDCSGPTYFN